MKKFFNEILLVFAPVKQFLTTVIVKVITIINIISTKLALNLLFKL